MPIRAVVFDIGGVLEVTPQTGWEAQWEARLHLRPGELDERLTPVWRDGSSGALSEADVEQQIAVLLGLDNIQSAALMADLWNEYLGELNVALATYFASLRPRYRTAILSNSFAGARRQEQERYHFAEMCDLIIYSHEEGMRKPERRIFALTCARLDLSPDEIIFLDDSAVIVAAACETGIHAILFHDTTQAIAAIEACLHEHTA
jgi:epoxide hydrolase-like predicted phosphatase